MEERTNERTAYNFISFQLLFIGRGQFGLCLFASRYEFAGPGKRRNGALALGITT